MVLKRFKANELLFLGYALDQEVEDLPEYWQAEVQKEPVDLTNEPDANLQIIHIPEAHLFSKRTRDRILEEAGIQTYADLCMAYFLIKNKTLNRSKTVRDYVLEKYAEIMNFVTIKKDDE